MAHVLIMPRQGNTVESCIITDWKVKEGDTVTTQTIVCEVETDKAAFEIQAGADGVVLKLLRDSGDDVLVLTPIAIIGASDEDWNIALGETGSYNEDTIMVGKVSPSTQCLNTGYGLPPFMGDVVTKTPPVSEANSGISPRARNLVAKETLSLDVISGTGPGGRIIERDVLAEQQNRHLLTAAAKAAAAGVLHQEGTGLDGRITKSDLSAALSTSFSGEGAITETPIKGIRKIIADRMIKSLVQSAQFTLNTSASAVKLQEIRSSIKTVSAFSEDFKLSKITLNDLILFAVSRVLPQFPLMNAYKTGDTIKTFERVHLAFAVDTSRGLMVPVVRNANLLSIVQISSETRWLSEACRNGTAKPDELSGSTFTVTNLGSLGITSFTPVLNMPEVAILGVGCIEMKPAILSESEKCCCRSCFEPHINFSLTINHQVVDGAPAGRFLKALCEAIANIDVLLAKG
jgi:pyruvate dehydrogenase E2 component (dihydrolipoamide acetyltransferase)